MKFKQAVVTWASILMLALPLAGVILVAPQPARAQFVCANCSQLLQDIGVYIKDVIWVGLKQGAAVAWKNALKNFVGQIAYDTAVWIGSGDKNQKPLLYSETPFQYIKTVGDSAVGLFLDEMFSENGYFTYDLCQPVDVNAQFYLNMAIGIAIPMSDYSIFGVQLPQADFPRADCTVSDIIDNFEEASLDVDFATNIALIFVPTNNDFGVLGTAVGTGYNVAATQQEDALISRINGDFQAVQGKVSEYIATPASVVEHQYFLSLDASTYVEQTYTGQLVADTIDIFTSTLMAQLLARLRNGLISDFTTPDISDSLSGSSATTGGVSAAEEKYLTFKETPLTRGGDLDILSALVNCPDQGREVANCTIDDGFRSAIEQGKTLRQALDEGFIDGSKPFGFGEGGLPIETPQEGIPYRSTIILKHYRIVPVGWQIAAEYIRDFGGGTSITLQDLVDAHDQCSSTDYSPYCKLVDPDWVLVSPDAICNVQGFGQNILSGQFQDDDGLDSTPERFELIRNQSCVDDQTCLKTDSDGNCMAYGYCTQEKRIYRFVGDECPEQYSSCQTFITEDDNEVSYLRNTLNYNDCDANSVGCQWYCTVYNDINLDWQCSANGYIYNYCSEDEDTWDSADSTCGCTADDGSTCDMLEGAFKCTTDTGATCTLGESEDEAFACNTVEIFGYEVSLCANFLGLDYGSSSGLDSAINFNNQVETCNEDDAGCTTFVRTTTGANLVFNSSFEYFNSYNDPPEDVVRGDSELSDSTADTFGFFSAGAEDPATACSADDGDNECIGWETGGSVFATGDDVFDGYVSAELASPATLTYELETGYALADRTFDLVMYTQNTSGSNCLGQIELNGTMLENADYDGPTSNNILYEGNDTWTTNDFEPFTYPSSTTDTELSLAIIVPGGCGPIKVDAVDLVETEDASSYTAYGTNELISLNQDRLECEVEDIGCELYTPVGGTDDDAIPGQITNSLSEACTGADGFADPDCSQCTGDTSEDEFVGCDFYQEQPLTNAAPIPSLDGFTTLPTGDERQGIVQRTGYYCNNSGYEGVSCYDDTDCGGTTGACVDSLSIIPSTAQTCSAQYVGCEEFTNLDEVSAGGEALEYYTYIRQCVKDTPEQRAADEVHTYVTFEGSDISGYSLRSFDLKKSNIDDGPCTNLDLYDTTAQTSEAACIDASTTQQACTAADVGVDPDCTEFIDPDDGTSYYRLKSYTITASDDCHPLRNSLDGRIYYSVPDESISCPAGQNLCREYQGSAGGDVFEAVNENFEDSVWDNRDGGGTIQQSSESTSAGGHSMELRSAEAVYDLFTVGDEDTYSLLDEGKTYAIRLWIKEDTSAGGGFSIYFDSATSTSADATVYFVNNDVDAVSGDTVELENEWHEYTFGPVVMPRAGEDDDQLVIAWDDSNSIYVDNVVLEESDSQYLIKNTASSCTGYEGCDEYTDRDGDTHYIKSFTKLCQEEYVGCEALVTTQNSDSPFSQTFLTDNTFDSNTEPNDDVIVSEDGFVAYVNDEENYCAESAAGCMALGQPDVDEVTGDAESYGTVHYLNDPDTYSTTLCESDSLACDEFTSDNDEVVYFKDPGDKTCEYRQASSGTEFGWFVVGTDDECPLFDDSATLGQPMGPVCDGGTRDGLFCSNDDDCPDDDTTDEDEPHCREDLSTDSDGDGYPDTGWVGTCSSAYSGCTEYQDANTDNLIPNGDMEEDEYTYDTTTLQTDDTVEAPDGRPDYFEDFFIFDFNNFLIFVCDSITQTDSFSHSGKYSVEVVQDGVFATGDGIGCDLVPEEVIDIDTSKTYTFSFNVLVNRGYEGTANETQISAGLAYLDVDGNLINPYDWDDDGTTWADDYDYNDLAAYNVAASGETISADEEGIWLRYSGQIGNRLEYTWPSVDNEWGEDVVTALPYVYIYTPSGAPVFIDNFSFTENDDYFYVNTSVDGAPESEQNSCNGEVEIGQGCVAFRDVTNDSLSYLSVIEAEQDENSDFSATSCVIGATESESENCRFNQNTSDSNVVLEVRPDRECEEWFTCKTASITTDASGNQKTTCFEIDRCDELSESGLCARHLPITSPDDLSSSSDLTFRSGDGATRQLDKLKNLSGYSKVGLNWDDNTGTCTAGICADGPYAGNTCSTDDDCTQDVIVEGYYPFSSMTQEGEDGLSGEQFDLIQFGDFEEVYCNGSGTTTISFDSFTVDADDAFSLSRDRQQRCTVDDHCRNQETQARLSELQTIDQQDGDASLSTSLDYSDGWCSNPYDVNQGWNDWQPTDSNSLISIVDYDPTVDFDNPNTGIDDEEHPVPGASGSTTLDLNNVLYVEPSDVLKGVEIDIDNNVVQNDGQYTLSFDMAYASAPTEDDTLVAYLEFSDGSTTTTDYFKNCTSDGSCGNTDIEGTELFETFELSTTVASKDENATTTTLHIVASGSSDFSPFYLDNVSMLPTLEINKSLNNIARECRAYPAEDALLCNYTDDNGAVYAGIHGYCIEHDGMDRKKCVTWWPVDQISGDTDSRSKDTVRYEGRVPLYYCAVAKGVQDLAVCDGGERDGSFCTDYLFDLDGDGMIGTNNDDGENEFETADDYCTGTGSSGECNFGEVYYVRETNSDEGQGAAEMVGLYRHSGNNNSLYRLDGAETNERGYQAPLRSAILATEGVGNSSGEGMLVEFAANPAEQMLTVSDIADITLEFFVEDSYQDQDNEWPLNEQEYSLVDETDGGDDPNIEINGSTVSGVTVHDWSNDDGDVIGKKCQWVHHDFNSNGTGTIKFVYNTEFSTADPVFCNYDPFSIDLSDGANFARDGDLEDEDDMDDFAWHNSTSDYLPSSRFTEGENDLIAIQISFDHGALSSVQHIVYSEIGGDDVSLEILFKYSLQETCAYVVQAVDSSGGTTTWMDRINNVETFTMPGSNYTYTTEVSPFGSIVALDGNTPDQWDQDGNEGWNSSVDGGLLLTQTSASDTSASALTCVGRCESPMCTQFDEVNEDPSDSLTQECPSSESDYESGNACTNEGGTCTGVPDANGISSGAGTVGTDGFGDRVNSYNDQLFAAALEARDDLRLIFPELSSETVYVRDYDDTNSRMRNNYNDDQAFSFNDNTSALWDNTSSNDIFDNMSLCSSSTRDADDYCAYRPDVYNITVNDQVSNVYLDNGEAVTLRFSMSADGNQEPVSDVNIEFEGDPEQSELSAWDYDNTEMFNDNWQAAATDDMAYSHAFTCDSNVDEEWEDGDDSDADGYAGVCVYEVRVQVKDSWGFCSGEFGDDSDGDGNADSSQYRNDCESFDKFGAYIIVSPE